MKKILAVKVKCICYTTQSLLWFLIYDRSTIREWQLLEWNLGGLMLVKRFVPFYWNSYVSEARSVWIRDEQEREQKEKVVFSTSKGKVVNLSKVFDYTYRSEEFESVCL